MSSRDKILFSACSRQVPVQYYLRASHSKEGYAFWNALLWQPCASFSAGFTLRSRDRRGGAGPSVTGQPRERVSGSCAACWQLRANNRILFLDDIYTTVPGDPTNKRATLTIIEIWLHCSIVSALILSLYFIQETGIAPRVCALYFPLCLPTSCVVPPADIYVIQDTAVP